MEFVKKSFFNAFSPKNMLLTVNVTKPFYEAKTMYVFVWNYIAIEMKVHAERKSFFFL